MKAGYGRGTYGSGEYGSPLPSGGGGELLEPDYKYLKRLKLQQQRLKDDEEVAALLLLQIMRGKNYG